MSQSAPLPQSSPLDPSTAFAAAVARAAPSVVRIPRRRGSGSGIAWTPDLIITSSFHAASDSLDIAFAASDGSGQLITRTATLVARDRGTDVALYRVADGGLVAAPRRASLGELAAGYLTFALARPGRTIRASLRAVEAVAARVRTPAGGRLAPYLETDRRLPRGFAGGPLVDLAGDLIGMNTRTLIGGVDLAVSTTTLDRVVGALLTHGHVPHGVLGIGAYRIDGGSGVLVAKVDPGGAAANAGIVVGDIITAVDGNPIGDPDDLQWQLADRAGESATLTIRRGTSVIDQKVDISSAHTP